MATNEYEAEKMRAFQNGEGSLGPFMPIWRSDPWYTQVFGIFLNFFLMIVVTGLGCVAFIGLPFALILGLSYGIIIWLPNFIWSIL